MQYVNVIIISIALTVPSVPLQTFVSDCNFEIVGRANGLPSNSVLYLELLNLDGSTVPLDSSVIVKGCFSFSGCINDSIQKVLVRTADFTSSVFFWLEQSNIQINIERRRGLTKAKITGSNSQDEQGAIDSAIRSIEDKKVALKKTLGKKISIIPYSIEFNALEKTKWEQIASFIKRNKESILSASFIYENSDRLTSTQTLDGYHWLSQNLKNSPVGRELFENVILSSGKVKIGSKFIDFEQPDVDGNLIKLSNITADVVLLEFWASKCGPCRVQNPELLKVYNEFKAKDFEILAVSLDKKKEDWIKAIHKDGLTWKNVSDLRAMKNDAVQKYGVLAMPFNFLIRDGIIIGKNLTPAQLRHQLTEL
jgi:peroxiredoxin